MHSQMVRLQQSVFSLKKGGSQVQNFLKNEGSKWSEEFKGMDPQQPGLFESKWKEIAAKYPDEMFNAQHAYIERTHYQPVIDKVLKNTGVDLSSRSSVVQDVAWSTSVQHGAASKILTDAVNEVKTTTTANSADFDKQLINQVYKNRTDYVNNLSTLDKSGKASLAERYVNENTHALEMLSTGE